MCAMDSLIRTYVWAVLITGIFGMPVSRIKISEGPNYYVKLGSTINLTCLVAESTSPLGELSWLRDGQGVYKDFSRGGIRVTTEYGPNTVSLLQIQNATSNDGGKYTCQSNQGEADNILVYVLEGRRISEPLDSSNSTKDSSCVYEGIVYDLGEFVYPDQDNSPCFVCECKRENWDGVDNQRCFERECTPDYDGRRALEAGCIPVYQERKCCPVRYYCPQIVEDSFPGTNDTNENSSVNDNQCHFEGKAYDVGTEVSLNNSCIECSCSAPPVMRCTRLPCPSNERNCPLIYKDNECCPTLNCPQEDKEDDSNEGSSEENIYENCPTPMCAHKSCVIGVPPGHQCPTCICDREVSKEKDLEASHEKNDLEPLFEEIEPEPPYIEIYNGTETLDNEIPSSIMSKNYTEREFLSPEFEKNDPQKDELEGGEKNRNSTTKIFLLNEDESSLNETEFESSSLQSNKLAEEIANFTMDVPELRQKRSGNLETAGIQSSNSQQQWNIYQQDQFIEDSEDSGENSERELEGTDGEYSEVKVLSTKNAQRKTHNELVELEDNELENVVWTTEVPGCPAPMCANSSCRIGIPPGHTCPTCVCRKRRRQP